MKKATPATLRKPYALTYTQAGRRRDGWPPSPVQSHLNLPGAGTTGFCGTDSGPITGIGRIDGIEVSFGIMDFAYIGGSMGSVVGERVARTIERAIEREIPLIIVSCSGGLATILPHGCRRTD